MNLFFKPRILTTGSLFFFKTWVLVLYTTVLYRNILRVLNPFPQPGPIPIRERKKKISHRNKDNRNHATQLVPRKWTLQQSIHNGLIYILDENINIFLQLSFLEYYNLQHYCIKPRCKTKKMVSIILLHFLLTLLA